MKNISNVINDLDLSKKDDHLLQNKVPQIVKTIVDNLFDQLAFIFPAWKYTWDTKEKIKGAKKEWVKAFFENNISTKEQISNGLKIARKMDSDFLPSCGKFVSWCSPSPENIGWPSTHEALKKCIEFRSHKKLFGDKAKYCRPMIIELCKKVDWWIMNNANNQVDRRKADNHFLEMYIKLFNSGYVEPEQTSLDRLPTQETVNAGMSDKQKGDKKKRDLNHIKNIKNKLKQARYK